MIEKISGIVLSTIKHSDKSAVVNVYTPTHGRLPLLVSLGAGKSARMRAAQTMPLAQVEFSCTLRPTRELQRPSGLTIRVPYRDLYFNPLKNATGIFIAEFLNRLLRDATPDAVTFRFLSESLLLLDALEVSPANFHITLLSQLTSFMGIAPDLESYTPGALFDMRAGRYATMLPGHSDILTGDEARVPLLLDRLTFGNMHRLSLSRAQRNRLLQELLHYWGLHYPGLNNMQSPAILAQVFV